MASVRAVRSKRSFTNTVGAGGRAGATPPARPLHRRVRQSCADSQADRRGTANVRQTKTLSTTGATGLPRWRRYDGAACVLCLTETDSAGLFKSVGTGHCITSHKISPLPSELPQIPRGFASSAGDGQTSPTSGAW